MPRGLWDGNQTIQKNTEDILSMRQGRQGDGKATSDADVTASFDGHVLIEWAFRKEFSAGAGSSSIWHDAFRQAIDTFLGVLATRVDRLCLHIPAQC